MAFCDLMLWNLLFQATSVAVNTPSIPELSNKEEQKVAEALLADDGLGEAWKSVPLSASWSFWKDLTKPHNKVGMKTQDFAKHLQETGHFSTFAALDDIWQARTKNLRMFSNLRVFRDPIKPLWEVPQNKDGGKFVIILGKVDPHEQQGVPTSPGKANGSSLASGTSQASSTTSGYHCDDSEYAASQDNSQVTSTKSGSEKPSTEVPIEYKLCLALMVLGLLGPVSQFCGCVLSIRAFGNMISIWTSSSSDKVIIEGIKSNIARYLQIPLDSITFQRHNESIRNNTRNLTKTETRKRMREARAKGDTIEPPPQAAQNLRRKSDPPKPVWGKPGESGALQVGSEKPSKAMLRRSPSDVGSTSSSGSGSQTSMPPKSPRSRHQHHPQQGQHGHQQHAQHGHPQPSTPQHATSSSLSAQSEPARAAKSRRASTSGRNEKVTFHENVVVQTIDSNEAPSTVKAGVPAPLRKAVSEIPEILIGTPPSSRLSQFEKSASTSIVANQAPNAPMASSSTSTVPQVQATTSQTSSTGSVPAPSFKTMKRRARSATSYDIHAKANPNYVSPEALFGADLPLLSPLGTPYTSVPPSPPTELDDEDYALIGRERPSEDLNQKLSDKLAELSQQRAGEAEHIHIGDASQKSDNGHLGLAPSSSHEEHGTAASRRRRHKKRKSTSDAADTQPVPLATPTNGGETVPKSVPTEAQSPTDVSATTTALTEGRKPSDPDSPDAPPGAAPAIAAVVVGITSVVGLAIYHAAGI